MNSKVGICLGFGGCLAQANHNGSNAWTRFEAEEYEAVRLCVRGHLTV